MQRAFWDDRAATKNAGLVVLMVLATYASILLTVPETRTWTQATAVAIQLLLPAALASAVFLCIACRLYHRAGVAWFAAAAVMIGVQGFPLLVAPASSAAMSAPVLTWSAIALGVAVGVLVWVARARRTVLDPVPLGIAFGIALVLVRGALELLPGSLTISSTQAEVGGLVLLVVGAALATMVWRQSCLPPRSRRQLAAAVVLWSVSGSLRGLELTDTAPWAGVAIACALTTCVLVMSTALDLLGQAVRDDHDAVLHLQQQLLTLRAKAREGVEQLHEVKGTIAGIASATDLIRHEGRLTRQHREHLAEMLAQETARLQRLVHKGPTSSTRVVDLDELVQPLLAVREAQGLQVVWDRCEHQVVADTDELTEVLNILLHNAAEHAPGSPVRIYTRLHDGDLELVVADRGPGVAPELVDRIFEWGYGDSHSNGQGVGLAVAHRLMARRGASLYLDREHSPGAAFVIQLQPVEQERTHREAALVVR